MVLIGCCTRSMSNQSILNQVGTFVFPLLFTFHSSPTHPRIQQQQQQQLIIIIIIIIFLVDSLWFYRVCLSKPRHTLSIAGAEGKV